MHKLSLYCINCMGVLFARGLDIQSLKLINHALKLSNKNIHLDGQLPPGFQSRRNAVDKALTLYSGVLISITGSTSLSGDILAVFPNLGRF